MIAKCLATLRRPSTDRLPDRGGAPERLAWTSHALLDAGQLARGGIEQVVALAPALLGQRRIAAHHQARVRSALRARSRWSNRDSCKGPPSAASARIAGARSRMAARRRWSKRHALA